MKIVSKSRYFSFGNYDLTICDNQPFSHEEGCWYGKATRYWVQYQSRDGRVIEVPDSSFDNEEECEQRFADLRSSYEYTEISASQINVRLK